MNNEKAHIVTGVWYKLDFCHIKYRHFPCSIEREHYRTGSHRYISACESCVPISRDSWGADYDTLNGASTRSTKELINLTKSVCDTFLNDASFFANIKLPMIKVSVNRLISGASCYQGCSGYINFNHDFDNTYDFVYSRINYPVTPSNISDVLGKKVKNINVVKSWPEILWDQQSNLDPNTPLYVCNCDEYDNEGGVYVKILDSNTDVVNTNLCLVHPSKTGHIPSLMAELFRKKTAPVAYHAQRVKGC